MTTPTVTYKTNFGLITLFQNELYIGRDFYEGKYWDLENLMALKKVIDPNRNILEVGGHCGTSTLVYASFISDDCKVYVYEPQKKMFELLVHNISQNNLQNKIIPINKGFFCYEGLGKMNDVDLDGGMGNVMKRYEEENNLWCNFGGISLGSSGEDISLTTIDSIEIDNLGFIHCDAQGSENFIFSKATKTIAKHRPIIYYEDNFNIAKYLFEKVQNSYPQFMEESLFDIRKYCQEELGYTKHEPRFDGKGDSILIP